MKKMISLAALLLLSWSVSRSNQPATADDAAAEPLGVVIHVDVIPPSTAAGREALRQFVAETRKDAGAERIEVFEELSRPNHSTIVELWKDRKSYDDHLALDHTRAFRVKLQPMLGSPFDERLHRPQP